MYAKTIGIIPRSDGVSMEDSLKKFLEARGVNEENMLHLEDEKVSMISKYNDDTIFSRNNLVQQAGARHLSPISLVPHHWSPFSLVPHLIGPPISTHPPPIPLVPHLICPPNSTHSPHWSPISLAPWRIGPPSHWSPISLVAFSLVPQSSPPSHWFPFSLVPHYWSIPMVPHLIGPPV